MKYAPFVIGKMTVKMTTMLLKCVVGRMEH